MDEPKVTTDPAAGSGANGTPAQAAVEDAVVVSDSAEQLAALAAERDRLATEKADLHDRLLRRQAEFDNFRRRVERERGEAIDLGRGEAISAVLPVVDDFERALKVETADKEYARGMELIYLRLSESLKKLGLEPVPSTGQKFDPNVHHAIELVKSEDAEDQTILDEYQKGYQLRGKLLRPAMVKVATRP